MAYIGGVNIFDAAALYLKKCFQPTDNLVASVTWLGSKKNKIIALKETLFATACKGILLNLALIFKKFIIITFFVFKMLCRKIITSSIR